MKFKREILGEWVSHDEDACNALKEYDSKADYVPNPARFMQEVADKNGTTIAEMKKHWRCIPLDEKERHALNKD